MTRSYNEKSKLPKRQSQPSGCVTKNQEASDLSKLSQEMNSEDLELLRTFIQDLKSSASPVSQITSVSKYYSGPFPPAELISDLENARPGAGQFLLDLTERQTIHRQTLENLQVSGQEKRMGRGQIFGFVIGTLSILAGPLVIILTNSWPGMWGGVFITAIGVGGVTVAKMVTRSAGFGIQHRASDDTKDA
jgi:uncharacterized membrane protein